MAVICMPTLLSAEYIFLKDGSITESEIVQENDLEVALKNTSGETTVIPRNSIMRINYSDEFKVKKYIYKKDESEHTGYIVFEDAKTYIYRPLLDSPDEKILDKKDITAIQTTKRVKLENLYLPAGIFASFTYFLPLADRFSSIYPSLAGGDIGYSYLINKNLSFIGRAEFIYGTNKIDTASTFHNSYSAGIRGGIPGDFIYPYVSILAGVAWIYEWSDHDSSSFPGYSGEGAIGLFVMFSRSMGLYAECAYSYSKAADADSTDISGVFIRGGAVYKVF